MATERPDIDLFHSLFQTVRDDFERQFLPEGGLEGCEEAVGRVYNEEFKRPYVCALMADVTSGRWGLGKTQEEISERLGVISDRTWISRALHDGRLSLEMFVRLRCCPSRPIDWEPDIVSLQGDMGRSGFIGVARFLAEMVTTRPTLVTQRLNELNYEIVCEIFGRFSTWLFQEVRGDATAALRIVNDVCSDTKRNVNPAWYSTRRGRETEKEIRRISSNETIALEHLRQLQHDWFDVFVATYSIVESVDWSAS